MYAKGSHSRPCLALFVHECVCPSFSIVFIITLILLNASSNGQLIAFSRASQESSVPSNTSLSTNALKDYVIYSVVEGSSPGSANENIRSHLEMILAPAYLQEYGGDSTGVEFWRVKMSDLQRAVFVRAYPRVQIYENTQFLYHPDLQFSQTSNQSMPEPDLSPSEISNGTNMGLGLGSGTIYQPDAPSDLKVVSWASGVPWSKTKSYAYDPAKGDKAIIYIIANGIDGRSREFTWPPPDWLYAPGVKRTKTDDDSLSHGSCVASKATGARNGVSKSTRLVVVKSSLDLVDIAWAFQRIVNIAAKQKSPRIVVLLTATTKTPWRSELFQDARYSRLYLRIGNLISLGAVVVVPSGDYGSQRRFVDTVPAVFASPSQTLGRPSLPLIVAGAVDDKGNEASWSQMSQTAMIWAPGVKVACKKKGWNFRPTDTGTSFSAGMVAGLAAYILGMRNPPFTVGGQDTSRNLMNYILNSASWDRQKGGRKVIWNQLDGSLVSLSNASTLSLATVNASTY